MARPLAFFQDNQRDVPVKGLDNDIAAEKFRKINVNVINIMAKQKCTL